MRQQDRSSRVNLTWRMISMKWKRKRLRLIAKTLSKIPDREIFLTKMWRQQRRKRGSNWAQFRVKRTSSKNFRIRSRGSKPTLPNSRKWFTSSKKTSKNMVLKLQMLMLNTTSASSKSNWKIISSPNSKRKILKPKEDSSNSKIFTRQSDLTGICIQRIFWRPKKKLLSWKWSSGEWLSKSPNLRRRSSRKINQSFLKMTSRESRRSRTLNSPAILRRSKEIFQAQRRWSGHRRQILLVWNMWSVKL